MYDYSFIPSFSPQMTVIAEQQNRQMAVMSKMKSMTWFSEAVSKLLQEDGRSVY